MTFEDGASRSGETAGWFGDPAGEGTIRVSCTGALPGTTLGVAAVCWAAGIDSNFGFGGEAIGGDVDFGVDETSTDRDA